MFELNVTFFALAIPAVLFSGMSKGGFGSGAAFAAAPILALIVPPAAAVGLMLPLLIVMDFTALGPYWKKWSLRHSVLLMVGAVPGVILGAMIFKAANPDVLRALIGFVAIAFVAYRIVVRLGLLKPREKPYAAPVGLFAGAVSGFSSYISHAGGPPAAVYLISERLDKMSYQATTVLTFTVINLMKVGPYAALGVFTAETLRVSLMLAPFALVGAWLGVVAHRFVSERFFFGLTYVLLTMTGTKLLWDAFT